MTISQQTTATERTTHRSLQTPAAPERIEMTDPAAADSLNKKTVGIRQLGDVLTLQRLKAQNALNRQLVADAQAQLRQSQGPNNGSSDMTNAGAGAASADDQIQIGDTAYHINVGDPSQLQAALAALKDLQEKQDKQAAQAAQPLSQQTPAREEPATNTTITAPPGTPIQVNPAPAQALPGHPQVITVPREQTTMEKVLPWALLGMTALAAGGIGYATRPAVTDADTRYSLEFDESAGAPVESPIPTPRLEPE